MDNIEKRVHKRFEAGEELWAETILSENFKTKDKIINISMGGICLETSQHPAYDDIYRIKIGSGNNRSIVPKAKVVWSSLIKTKKQYNDIAAIYKIGLKFTDMNDDEKFSLHKLIIKLLH
jgi:hypothetical protein